MKNKVNGSVTGRSRAWIVLSCVCSLFLATSNAAKVEITLRTGWETNFYNALGSVVVTILFDLWCCIDNSRKGGSFWVDQNIVVNGKLKTNHLLLMVIFCCCHFGILNMIFFTLYYAGRSSANVGVITSIWCIVSFVMGVADYFLFGIRLKTNQLVGMGLVSVSIVLLGVKDILEPTGTISIKHIEVTVPVYIPVILAICSTFIFTSSGMMGKHMVQEKHGFQSTTISFTAILIINLLILIVAVVYWAKNGFDLRCMWLGIISGGAEAIGKVMG